MCRDYLLRYETFYPILLSEIGEWWGSDAKTRKEVQIDIIGTSAENDEYIVGSCKFKNEKIGVDELELLQNYAQVFGKGKKYYYYIFSKSGFTQALEELAQKNEVKLIKLEDMY